jgi:hypothetical protein
MSVADEKPPASANAMDLAAAGSIAQMVWRADMAF